MTKLKIAILGATSHIAKGLINNFLRSGEFDLHLYARSSDKVGDFLRAIGQSDGKNYAIHNSYEDFLRGSYDVVINCVGVGTLKKLQGNYTNYFTVTEEYDNLVIRYLRDCRPDALYISFSSGAVYGRGFSAPVDENSVNSIQVNHIAKEYYYSIARLNAETKHRAFSNLNIVDLRLFSYFSRFIDLADGYFITEVLNSILNKKELITDSANIIRDYVHPQDLFLMVMICIKTGKINAAFDVMSVKPVKKKEILDYFAREHGLKYKTDELSGHLSATGAKNVYYSICNNAAAVGYKPEFSSMDTIKQESKHILNKTARN